MTWTVWIIVSHMSAASTICKECNKITFVLLHFCNLIAAVVGGDRLEYGTRAPPEMGGALLAVLVA